MKASKILFFSLLLVLALLLSACSDKPNATTPSETTVPEPEPTYISVIAGGKSDYAIVFAQRSTFPRVSQIAMDLRSTASQLGASLTVTADSKSPVAHEILLGDTSRPETAAIRDRLAQTASPEHFQIALAEMNGKIVVYADHLTAYQYSYLFDFLLENCVNNETKEMKIAEGTYLVKTITFASHEAWLQELEEQAKAEAEAKRRQEIADAMAAIDAFSLSDFGKVTTLVSIYEEPPVYPGEAHPRILVTPETIDTVRANLTHPENAAAYEKYLENSDMETTGALAAPGNGEHNYSTSILSAIEAKAFRYLMTGDELYGYQAVLAIKNFLTTLVIPEGADPNDTRWFSYTIYITACVYDWCYDLLDADDKRQLVAGVETILAPNIEMGFPPSGQGAVTGHGTEDTIYRDWLCFAIAAYDDYPDLYEFVAGRLFQDFADAGEFYMQSGSHWQGSAYGPNRYFFMLNSEAIISAMTNGSYHLFSDKLELPAITFMNYIRPDNQAFRVGDDFNEGAGEYKLGVYYNVAAMAAWLYDNPQLKLFAKGGLEEFSVFGAGHAGISSIMLLCLNNPELEVSDATVDDLPLVLYNGSPLGSIIARSAWDDENAVAVYMKIGEAYSANHEHKDAGSFQIYYKGILASDSGYYDWYGSTHDYAYNKQTISSNSLLIYNPSFSTANSNTKWQYSGGQTISKNGWNGENGTLAGWISKGTTEYAKILGHGYGVDETASGEVYRYSYLAGDLTNAYDAATVDEVSRYMISIMTGDEENPMVFLVFDRITSTDASFKKTFLLHTQSEPTVGTDTADLYSDGGKLRVQSLLTDVSYTAIGGAGREFMVGDKNYPLTTQSGTEMTFSASSVNEAGWGRIEISPTEAKLTDHLLTVMYVTDKTSEASLISASEIVTDSVVGAEIFGKTVIFPKNDKKIASAFTFETSASGTTEYYFTGLVPGQWAISINGSAPRNETVSDGGVLTFTGETGLVSLSPAFSTIEYDLGGGTSTSPLPEAYNFGSSFTIPTDLTLYGSEFLGWYTTPDFAEGSEFTGISASDTEPIKLYAKWKKVFSVLTLEANGGSINEEYSSRLTAGEAYTLPLNVTKPNATFIGWYDNPGFHGEIVTTIPADHEEVDMTFYARFQTVYFSYDFENGVKISTTFGSSEIIDGAMQWNNPEGNSNFNFVVSGGYQDRSQTISFDLYLPEDGTNVMDFQVRLRPEMRNQCDLVVLTVKDGKVYLGSASSGVVILDNAVDRGWYRFTLVLENDNAGLAAGLAAEKGSYTTGDAFRSNLSVRAYVNGTLRGETVLKTYLTFGEGFYFTHNGRHPDTSATQDLTFSSQMTIVQFYSSFTPGSANCSTFVRYDNFCLADGILTVGGKYFLSYAEGAPANDDYIVGGEVVALPTLVGDGITFDGWYTTPDFREGTKVTDPSTMPAGTVFYAKTSSQS